jgi:hypothetical protein
MDKVDGPDADKSEWIKLEFFMDPDKPAWGSKYSRQFAIFKDGFQEEYIKWVMAFREIENLMPMKETYWQDQEASDFVYGSIMLNNERTIAIYDQI